MPVASTAVAATAPPIPTPLQYSETAIENAYQANRAILGEPAGSVECRTDDYPCWQTFTSGGLYVLAEFRQPIAVSGAIYLKWNTLGGLLGDKAGAPVGSMDCDAAFNCQQKFHSGTIYAQSTGPAVLVPGEYWIYNSYANQLGWPLADPTCSFGSVCSQTFERGLTYTRGTEQPAVTFGDVYTYYKANASTLGGPYTAPGCSERGCTQSFERGFVYSSPTRGTFTMTGAIQSFYLSSAQAGLGWPTSEEQCGLAGGGCVQHLEAGRAYWAPVVGPSTIGGGILSAWSSSGAERGALGYPISQEFCHSGLCYQRFQSGAFLVWSPGAGTQLTAGAIGAKFERYITYLGGPTTSQETCGLRSGGCVQHFARGRMYWAPGVGAWPIRGGMETTWRSAGAENGYLGYPTSPEYCRQDGTGCVQYFQGGQLIWGTGLGIEGGYAP
ncbi:LGFP repeat-containing protein [Pseudarthrobacter oxydans]|uniref:LGFP repeat-containing protein n=1 Tax=Pseudarthrobacter oxydans TaxID=1671 RepID=UPI003F5042EF